MRRHLLAALALSSSACAVDSAIGSGRTLSRGLADECVANCDKLGMRLSAVVLIMSSAGCVCEPKTGPASPAAAAGASAVVGAAVLETAGARAQEQQRSTQAQAHSAPTSAVPPPPAVPSPPR